MANTEFVQLNRHRVRREEGEFIDIEDNLRSESSHGGQEILTSKLPIRIWSVYVSGVDTLTADGKTKAWQPVNHRASPAGIWSPLFVKRHRGPGIEILNETMPTVVAASLRADRIVEIAIAASLLAVASTENNFRISDSTSMTDLLHNLFVLPEDSDDGAEVWIVTHKSKAPYFHPELALRKNLHLNARRSPTSEKKNAVLRWKQYRHDYGPKLTQTALSAASRIGSVLANQMHEKRTYQ